jgi:hypothetical protein
MFKSLLLALGLFQNQEQAALLSVNKTQEVCLASDAWMYQSGRENALKAFEEMKSAASCIAPVVFVVSAFLFSKEDSDAGEYEKKLLKAAEDRNAEAGTARIIFINGNRVSLAENPQASARRKRRAAKRAAKRRRVQVPPFRLELDIIEEEDSDTDRELTDG